jgi:antitoxin CcdA
MPTTPSGRKKAATNLSLRTDLVRRAKALGLNLSEAVDAALETIIRDGERRAWLEANRAAIDEYNARVEDRGVFSDDWRSF